MKNNQVLITAHSYLGPYSLRTFIFNIVKFFFFFCYEVKLISFKTVYNSDFLFFPYGLMR